LRAISAVFVAFLVQIVLTGCILTSVAVTPLAPPAPTESESTPVIDGWEQIAPGLERRVYVMEGSSAAQIVAVRIDPAHYIFRAHYQPGEPLRVHEWQQILPGAVALINSNFFDPQHRALGLLVTDGVVYGQSYQGRGGTFVVQNGVPRVRSNTLEPYTGEALEQAIQAFPMLILNSQQAYTDNTTDRITRRTAIGQDAQGRIVLMATPFTGMTLVSLSAFLAATDMQLINAFNLDGGRSTMMYIAREPQPYLLASVDPVPAVLAVYPR
jgi:hypothetical protein